MKYYYTIILVKQKWCMNCDVGYCVIGVFGSEQEVFRTTSGVGALCA